MADFYAACDVLVLPSNNDCFPAVLGEAMKMWDTCGNDRHLRRPSSGASDGNGKTGKIWRLGVYRRSDTRGVGKPRRIYQAKGIIANCFSYERTVDRFEAVFRKYARE